MNEHADGSELPELTDDDVEILYAICKRASDAAGPPFKALFAAYDEVFGEQHISQQHDGVVFRYLMRVGESTRGADRGPTRANLVEQLRSVLEAHGISFVAPFEDDVADGTQSVNASSPYRNTHLQSPRRRVSFDDARLNETWLSQHTESLQPVIEPPTYSGLLGLPARRVRDGTAPRRARSTSAQRGLQRTTTALPPSQPVHSHQDDFIRANFFVNLSEGQLEENAEAFLSTSALRSARKSLHAWYRSAIQMHQFRTQASSIAIAHDRRTLLSQAIDQWRAALDIRRQENLRLKVLEHLEERATRYRDLYLLTKAFTHWAISSSIERIRTAVAQRHVLKVTYFKKWRAIAHQNQQKAKSILTRKYVAAWREKTARRLLRQEQATAHYEDRLMRRCKTLWFWQFCSRRVSSWHDDNIQRRTFRRLRENFNIRQSREHHAETLNTSALARQALHCFSERLEDRHRDGSTAERHFQQIVTIKTLRFVQVQTKLAPISHSLRASFDVNLKRKTCKIWNLRASLYRQATEIDHRRILQAAWTRWNEALRCRALALRMNERVLLENLYRWVLQERCKLFKRMSDDRLLNRALAWWTVRVQEEKDLLSEAARVFEERERRRRLATGMLRLHSMLRTREDAERAALEMANARTMPKILDALKERGDHLKRLAKWAADARFYFLCTSTLRTWQARSSEARHSRKRNAYIEIRARVKIRLVGDCFGYWRARTGVVGSMHEEAERRALGKSADIGRTAFYRMREKTAQYTDLDIQAANTDHLKLFRAALSALSQRQADLGEVERRGIEFRGETDLTLMTGALKRMQWATFTVTRKVESADALLARYRDQHIKHMIRHWAAQAAAKRAAVTFDPTTAEQDPESPSLRPASRAASHSVPPSSPSEGRILHSTPGYLRTPSRSKRAARFKPLPAVVPFTPMAIEPSYFVTTPAPALNQQGADESMLGLTPQVTPFERKLRAGGFAPPPPSALRASAVSSFVNPIAGTAKSVRFAGSSRFRRTNDDGHEKDS
ncbi:Sfi1 spindle body protein-domain-containing protein [Neohortaea acidophila]|uniref:Sfi1 spindle body protein-domain-containing protein n=1 Tax=Neohortaea acidophila TaxID=245834 RepID=A0A6A6PJY0_9PEZI|nr:Sfi1 spindle body protein-domain-containing protein [Neohortaea acidophila]KAF2480106.1 Sfi1 spindle body protein-domain-containing protein [Neohortaea acidophila]